MFVCPFCGKEEFRRQKIFMLKHIQILHPNENFDGIAYNYGKVKDQLYQEMEDCFGPNPNAKKRHGKRQKKYSAGRKKKVSGGKLAEIEDFGEMSKIGVDVEVVRTEENGKISEDGRNETQIL